MADRKSANKDFNKNAKARDVAARLPEMDLDSQKLASLIHGLRRRTKAGQGTEFFNFRHFENGVDNPHKIDWKESAKRVDHEGNDELQMRDREMEVTQMIYIWCDRSKSMNFKAPEDLFPQQPKYSKREAAEVLTLAVSHLAVKSSERFTLLGSDLNVFGHKDGIERIRMELEEGYMMEDDEDLPKLPMHRGKKLPKNSHVFIFSDFLEPMSEIAEMIEGLRHAGVKGHLVQILDPAEVEFRYKGHIELDGMEHNTTFKIRRGEDSRHEIEQRIHRHAHDIEQLVKKIPGWNYSVYVTDQPLHEALVPLYGIRTGRMPKPTTDYDM